MRGPSIFAVLAVTAVGAAPAVAAPTEEEIVAVLKSDELLTHGALIQMNAQHAYAAGATGEGVVIAFVDSGVDPKHPDIAPNLSPDSVDIISRRGKLKGPDPHGMIAILAAGAFNGEGTMGVAHRATILAIRADNERFCGGCTYRSQDLARAVDYAVEAGAGVLNLSIVGDVPMKDVFVDALQRAAAAGVIIVAAGGNDRGARPTYPARYAGDDGLAGMMIAVGNHDGEGERASRSNLAGDLKGHFISAPGGTTSASAAYVSGAAALIREAFPGLAPAEVVAALLKGARDAGEPGIDRVYGHGLVDLKGAFAEAERLSGAP